MDTLSAEEKMHPLGSTPSDSWKYNQEDDEPNNYKSIKQRMAYNRRILGLDHDTAINHPLGVAPTDIFEINTQPSSIPHYAQFPENLIKSPMTASIPKEVCIKCGIPKEKIFVTRLNNFIVKQCKCNAGFRKGIVLDCFSGAGTVALVAEKLGFDWIGFELVEKNIKYSYERLAEYHKQKQFLDIEDYKSTKSLQIDAVKTKPLAEFL